MCTLGFFYEYDFKSIKFILIEYISINNRLNSARRRLKVYSNSSGTERQILKSNSQDF